MNSNYLRYFVYLSISKNQEGNDGGRCPTYRERDPQGTCEYYQNQHPEGETHQHQYYTGLQKNLQLEYHREKGEFQKKFQERSNSIWVLSILISYFFYTYALKT